MMIIIPVLDLQTDLKKSRKWPWSRAMCIDPDFELCKVMQGSEMSTKDFQSGSLKRWKKHVREIAMYGPYW